MKPDLLDTGVIVALLDRSERPHGDCARALAAIDAPLVTCEPVIAEACYLTRSLPGAPEAILQNVAAATFQIPIQLSRCAAAIQRIHSMPLREMGIRGREWMQREFAWDSLAEKMADVYRHLLAPLYIS